MDGGSNNKRLQVESKRHSLDHIKMFDFNAKHILVKFRQVILKHLIPEFIWPKVIILDHVPIQVRNAPYSFGVKYSLIKGDYEENERQLINNHIKAGDIIFEFGGSIGILTSILTEKVGPTGRIISVEASCELCKYSRTLFEKTDNVKIVNGYAFPVRHLNSKICINNFDESRGSLGGLVTYSYDSNQVALKENILDLEMLIDKFKLTPNVLIIDIEGCEKILSEQSPLYPSCIRMILIELHPYIYGQDYAQSIIDSITSEGFYLTSSQASVYLFERN